MSRFRRATAVLAAALLVGTGSVAYADNLETSGDDLSANKTVLAFGDVDCGATVSSDVVLSIVRSGAGSGGNINPNTYANDAVVNFSASVTGGDGISVDVSPQTITLDPDWVDKQNNDRSGLVTASVVLTATDEGAGAAEVKFAATGAGAGKDPSVTRVAVIDVTWNTLECVTNTAPSAPGAPAASSNVNQGGFTLAWDAATDNEDDALTYTLEGKDDDDTDWTEIASGLTGTEYSFGSDQPAEGTWVYRVKAVETETSERLESDYSATSEPVKVDRTAPNAPTAAADRAAEHVDGTTSWWKDTVTVTFTGAGDPGLPDFSEGSGVRSVTPAQTFVDHAPFTATGTATDHAGNVSAATTLSGSVDTTAPVVTASGPTTFIKGSSATIAWTASDTGSGLATAASGTIAVDTSSVGTHTVTVPAGTATDNVGHTSAAVEVTYTVVYDFNGFFKPVDMGEAVNVVNKAGSAVPLKFSLNGFDGMDVIKSAKFRVTGDTRPGEELDDIATAGQAGLSYDADADQYVYVWKTDKAWAGKSGELTVTLKDGTKQTVQFSFKK